MINFIRYKTKIFQFSKNKIIYNEYPMEVYEIGQRLDRYLNRYQLGGWSSVQMLIRKKNIQVKNIEGKLLNQPNYFLKNGDVLLINQKLTNVFKKKQEFKIQIPYQQAKSIIDSMTIFDNQNLIILNKKPGFTVQGGSQYQKNIFSLLSVRYKKENIHITQRLDKPTTGVLIFAKNLNAAQIIQKSIQQRILFNKYYLAVTSNTPPLKGYIRTNIQWSNNYKAKLSTNINQQSKDCITFYKNISETLPITNYQNTSTIGLKLITGRKHQIRCHLSEFLNCPILNDVKYGGQQIPTMNEDQIYLHAFQTILQNSQEIIKLFLINIKQDKINIENKNGIINLQNGKITIVSFLPESWNINSQINSYKLLQIGQHLHNQEEAYRKKLKNKQKITSIG